MVLLRAVPWADQVDEAVPTALDRRFQEGQPSANIIANEFEECAALITISRRRVIIARNRDEAAAGFADVIGILMKADTGLPSIIGGNKRLLSWVIDAGRQKPDPEARKSFDLLKHVLHDLRSRHGERAEWLASRATIFVANPDRGWIAQASLGASCPAETFGTAVRDSNGFFGRFKGDSWNRFPAATAFVRPKSGQEFDFRYFSHAAPPEDAWSGGARGERRITRANTRNEWLQLFFEASLQHRGKLLPSSNQALASKLFKKGFLTFAFDGFASLK